ncbi:MAG: aminoacyl-tRNA hydrolase [Deltaproteobacteria bacterium]|nr:aminoacyl-tRNA hydrolase [Candidatus Tharpella sp.]
MKQLLPDNRFLIVGLGNPGSEYAETRHNFGFMLLDRLREKLVPQSSFKYETDYQAEIAGGKLAGKSVWLVKPQTFMNLSGRTVRAILADHHFLDPQKIIVIHDDLDLSLCRIKLKMGGGSGGHNGINSLIEGFGSNTFLRLRLGVGGVLRSDDTIGYVLAPFLENEKKVALEVLERGIEGVLLILTSGVVDAMNKINRRVVDAA